MRTFTLPKAYEGQNRVVIAGRQFVNGQLTVDDESAVKLWPILGRFYGCTVSAIEAESTEDSDDDSDSSPSLNASQTKG